MCFAQPVEQKDPAQPANYALDQSYGQVTSSVTDAEGKTTGGKTIAETYNSNIKMGVPNKTPTTVTAVDPNGPLKKSNRRRDYLAAGANIQM